VAEVAGGADRPRETILSTVSLGRSFGGVHALDSVDFGVRRGEIHGLIGPNGAGKSTFVNVCTGLMPATRGKVIFESRDVTRLASHRRAQAGISRTFQTARLFPEETVLQNVVIAAEACGAGLGFHWGGRRSGPQHAPARQTAENALDLVGLADRAEECAGTLPFGFQRLLEIARTVAIEPKLLFLDEPAAGLRPEELGGLTRVLVRLRDQAVTLVLIEHNVPFVMGLCDSISVLHYGQKIATGTPSEVLSNPAVVAAYLGGSEET